MSDLFPEWEADMDEIDKLASRLLAEDFYDGYTFSDFDYLYQLLSGTKPDPDALPPSNKADVDRVYAQYQQEQTND